MAFWTETGKDPKRNFRFQIQFTNIGAKDGNPNADTIVWWAKKVTKPNFTIAEGKHVYLGHTFYYPGKVEWQEISMTLVDPVSPNAVAITNDIVREAGFVIPGTPATVETMGKQKFNQSIGDIVINQFDSDGNTVEQWTVKHAFLKSVKFSDLDYENDDLTTIEIGIRYDWAECKTGEDFASAVTSYKPQ